MTYLITSMCILIACKITVHTPNFRQINFNIINLMIQSDCGPLILATYTIF